MSSSENDVPPALSSEQEQTVSAAAAESSLLNKDKHKKTGLAAVTTSCACGVDVEGMKETRDDLIRRIKRASSHKEAVNENDDAGVPAALSSLYSCAALDLDDEDEDEPVAVRLLLLWRYLTYAHVIIISRPTVLITGIYAE